MEKQQKFLAFGIKYQRRFGENIVFVNGEKTRIYYAGYDYGKVVSQRGEVAVHLTNHSDEAKGVTIMLTIDNTGQKFPPWVVMAGKGVNPGIKLRKSLKVLTEKAFWSHDFVHFNAEAWCSELISEFYF